MKHAFCIIAHNEPEVFKSLCRKIDHPDNDIFVFIDKKSKYKEELQSVASDLKNSKITFLSNTFHIHWGSISLPKAEIALFEEAINSREYDYIHLISGVDQLLHPMKDFHSFFEENAGKEFVNIEFNDYSRESARRRVSYWYFTPQWARNFNKFLGLINSATIKIQKIFPFRRNRKLGEMYIGSQWASITSDFARYIISNKKQIYKIFNFTFAADEVYKQWLLLNSDFADKHYNNESRKDNLREIDWKRGNPYSWKDSDLEELKNSNNFFVRKISPSSSALLEYFGSL